MKVIPVDLNKNGKIDDDENFYTSMDDLMAAIASGKYPSPPARELFFVLKESPKKNKALTDFIKWVLTDGQKYVNEAGYIALPKEKLETEKKKLE
jgi:phosphate transport system substrate-binding protein